jgi:hypothetical protein
MARPTFLLLGTVLALLACPLGVLGAEAPGRSGEPPSAILYSRVIDPRAVADYHCHDLDWPLVRCFHTEEERDADVLLRGSSKTDDSLLLSSSADLALASVTYVLWYEHSNFGGASFSASGPVPDLGALGWSNRISSFKSTNGGHPKWWDGTNYSGTAWQWPVSYWVSYVGDMANDRFSSVKNVP